MEEQSQNTNEQKMMEKNIGMAVIAYIFFLIPLVTETKDDKFVKFHVKQGLLILCTYIAMQILIRFTVVGKVASIVNPVISIMCAVLVIVGISNALRGEEKYLPLIGTHAEKIFKF